MKTNYHVLTPRQEANVRTLIATLRSGDYTQGQGALRIVSDRDPDDVRHCCLGVVCDLVNPDGWTHTTSKHDYPVVPHGYLVSTFTDGADELRDESDIELTMRAQTDYGLDNIGRWVILDLDALGTDDGAPTLIRMHSSLVELNDHGMTFDDIADVLEYIVDHQDIVRFYGFDDTEDDAE